MNATSTLIPPINKRKQREALQLHWKQPQLQLQHSPGNYSTAANQKLVQEPIPRDFLQELWEFSEEFTHGFPGNPFAEISPAFM